VLPPITQSADAVLFLKDSLKGKGILPAFRGACSPITGNGFLEFEKCGFKGPNGFDEKIKEKINENDKANREIEKAISKCTSRLTAYN